MKTLRATADGLGSKRRAVGPWFFSPITYTALQQAGLGRIRIKGNQHMVVMAFDTTAITGKRVQKATLVCVKGEQEISGVSISTIATEWDACWMNGE